MNDLAPILYLVLLLLYFLPTLLGRISLPLGKIPLMGLLNAFLGWTVIGWILLMRWALSGEPWPRLRRSERPEPVAFDGPRERAEPATPWEPEYPDARPEVVALLEAKGRAELAHPESGVRVLVLEADGGYRLVVPTASLDPRRGQRHRARAAVSEALWRLYEYESDSQPDLADDDETWEHAFHDEDPRAAAAAALQLLCTIADVTTDARIEVS